jgi:uncharacterized protein (TIGR02246 family)
MSPEKELIAVNEERIAALLKADFETLARYIADEMIYTSAKGQTMTRDEVFEGFKAGTVRAEKMTMSEVEARVVGETGVVTYVADSVTRDVGGSVNALVRATATFIRRDGRWQLLASQSTPING